MRKAITSTVLLILFVVVWSAAWFAASIYAGRQVDGFIVAEARQGREWACPDRHLSGYPFALVVSCRDATYDAQGGGQRIDGQVAGLTATVSLMRPRHVLIELVPPFSYHTSDNQTQVGGTWAGLTLDFSPLTDPRMLDLEGTGIDVHGRFPGREEVGGRAATLATRFTVSKPQADPVVDFVVAVTGTPMPILDDLVGGGSSPIDAILTGRLDQTDIGKARTPEEAMENWRAAGGTLSLSNLVVHRGGASVTASGKLGLDQQHRLEGRLDASFVGLEPILARYGISGNVAVLGSLIGTLFGGGQSKQPAAPGALGLPISFGNGHLGIGPITTGVTLSPLY